MQQERNEAVQQVNMNINVNSVLTIVPDLIENHTLIFKVLPYADGTKSRVLGLQGKPGHQFIWYSYLSADRFYAMFWSELPEAYNRKEKPTHIHETIYCICCDWQPNHDTKEDHETMCVLYCIKNNFQEISKLTMPILYHSTNIVLLLNSNFTIKLNKESQTYSRCFK